MGFLSSLIDLDKWLFQVINSGCSNAFFDFLLPFFREKWFWAPFYLFVFAFALLNFRVRGWLIVLGLILSVGIADVVSSRLVKKNVQRLRPCNDPEMQDMIRERVACGGGYSFTSSHAANHFAAAVFLIGAFGLSRRREKAGLLGWAASIGFSQIYVGVHYPFDILFGAILGAFIGWAVCRAGQRFWNPAAHAPSQAPLT